MYMYTWSLFLFLSLFQVFEMLWAMKVQFCIQMLEIWQFGPMCTFLWLHGQLSRLEPNFFLICSCIPVVVFWFLSLSQVFEMLWAMKIQFRIKMLKIWRFGPMCTFLWLRGQLSRLEPNFFLICSCIPGVIFSIFILVSSIWDVISDESPVSY